MSGKNGVTALPSARKPLVLRSETLTYTIERDDGETVALAGYKKGPGCPLPILIEVDEALATVSENEPTAEEAGSAGDPTADPPIPPTPGTISPQRYYARLMYAERTLRRMMLQAVIPGLTIEDANVLASDEGPWKEILIELGWRQPDEVLAAQEEAPDPEAPGLVVSTGQPESPASVLLTPATTP